ncbi:MAG: hypothetical protein K8U57_22000 [Planctomycetes bacterium]|nr:hypothetical protein [Planctomycetota bacterium]
MSASCCGSDRKTVALISVSALFMIAVVGWVREANKEPRTVEVIVQQPVEMVEVLVAAKELTKGTLFTKRNVDELTQFANVPKSSVRPEVNLIKIKDDLIGKSLERATHKGEVFNTTDLKARPIVSFGDWDIMSLPFPPGRLGAIWPGARVEILASYIERNRREVFTLVPDLNVLAINGIVDFGPPTPDMAMVSFSVDEQQAKLIVLANHLNCHLELLLRHPDAPKRDWNYDKTFALLQSLQKQQEEPPLEVAPEPRAKGEN